MLGWTSAAVGGAALLALGVYFVVLGLDRADKLASVVGAFAALIGLVVSVYAVAVTRRGPARPSGQVVAGSTVAGGVVQVRGVRGSVRIGRSADLSLTASGHPPTGSPPTSAGSGAEGQSVVDTAMSGPARQVDDVGGDVDIER